jgi:glycosyltransferase involved in cell wall biosynthesis
MEFSVIVNAFNEELNLPDLFTSLKGIEDIVVIDHESTDKTVKLAKELGARVYTKELYKEIVVKADVIEFEKRYGIKPKFTEGEKIPNWSKDLNDSLSYAKNNWCFYIDCDERLVWDRKEIEKLIPDSDIITCIIKSPINSFLCRKLFDKSKVWFTCHTHSAVHGYNLRINNTDKMHILHNFVAKPERDENIKVLEFGFFKDQSPRMNFFLGREYYNHKEYDKCIKFLNMYLETSTSLYESAKAHTLIAACLLEKKDLEGASLNLLKAMRDDPYSKESFIIMGEICLPQYGVIWRKIADLVSKEQVVI